MNQIGYQILVIKSGIEYWSLFLIKNKTVPNWKRRESSSLRRKTQKHHPVFHVFQNVFFDQVAFVVCNSSVLALQTHQNLSGLTAHSLE